MAGDSINTGKGIEPGYQYTGPIEGQGDLTPLTPVPEAGSPMIMKDGISSATLEPGHQIEGRPIYEYDSPNVSRPTEKGLVRMALRRSIQEASIKGKSGSQTTSSSQAGTANVQSPQVGEANAARTALVTGGKKADEVSENRTLKADGGGGSKGGGNEWLQYPSRMGALFAALLEYQNNLSKSRFADTQARMLLENAVFKAGMENADLAKALKDLAATKEMIRAISSFFQAGIAFYQMGALINERGRARNEIYDENSKFSKDITAQQKKVDDLKQNQLGAAENATPKDIQDLMKQKPEVAKQIKEEQKTLDKLISDRDKEFDARAHTGTSVIDAKFRGINALSEGLFSVISSLYTRMEGDLEKQKGINEAWMQYANRLIDSANKSADESKAQIDKVWQLLIQQSADTKARLSTHG